MPDDLTVPALVRRLERALADCRTACVTEADAMAAWRQRAEMAVRHHLARLVEAAGAELGRDEVEAG